MSSPETYHGSSTEAWQRAYEEGGSYHFVTVVDEESAEEARTIVAKILELEPSRDPNAGVLKRIGWHIAKRRVADEQAQLTAQLFKIARHELRGNAGLAQIEEETGLWEPYSITELCGVIVNNIHSGRFETVPRTDQVNRE